MASLKKTPTSIWLLMLFPLLVNATESVYYSNVTLASSVVSTTVYLPANVSKDNHEENLSTYYKSSRFEHGSMIGSIVIDDCTLYDTDLWRVPHDPEWAESGVGLASEYGCGDDGATCDSPDDDIVITNGVLGYEEAGPGGTFLKIGVGALVKGSCENCNGDVYKFNKQYQFASTPIWKLVPSPEVNSSNAIVLEHEQVLGGTLTNPKYGYRLQKSIKIEDDVLKVKSTLTNLGKERFATPWYSHHFFSSDGIPIGPGYQVDLSIESSNESNRPLFTESSVGSWSTPIQDYATVKTPKDATSKDKSSIISLIMTSEVQDGIRIKAAFDYDGKAKTDGSFALHAPGRLSVYEAIEELQAQEDKPSSTTTPTIYAYNLYIERGTLSPEPILLVDLEPGETSTWTQTLEFGTNHGIDNVSLDVRSTKRRFPPSRFRFKEQREQSRGFPSMAMFPIVYVAFVGAVIVIAKKYVYSSNLRYRKKRYDYVHIPNVRENNLASLSEMETLDS